MAKHTDNSRKALVCFQSSLSRLCRAARSFANEEAELFYRELRTCGLTVRVGMEASGHARWFERLLAELHWVHWGRHS